MKANEIFRGVFKGANYQLKYANITHLDSDLTVHRLFYLIVEDMEVPYPFFALNFEEAIIKAEEYMDRDGE